MRIVGFAVVSSKNMARTHGVVQTGLLERFICPSLDFPALTDAGLHRFLRHIAQFER